MPFNNYLPPIPTGLHAGPTAVQSDYTAFPPGANRHNQ